MRMRLIVLAAVSAWATAAEAQPDAELAGVLACADIADPDGRLACYDAAAPKLKAALEAGSPVEPAGDIGGPAPATAPTARSAEDLGLPLERPVEETTTFAVAAMSTTATGKVRVEMENGQVWTQTGYERIVEPRGAEIVAEISPGMLGSYFMRLNGGKRFRVERIR